MRTLEIKKEKIEKWNRLLNSENVDLAKEGLDSSEEILECWGIKFDNDIEADLMVVHEGNAIFLQVKWYNVFNDELDFSEPSYRLDDEWNEEIEGIDCSFKVVAK